MSYEVEAPTDTRRTVRITVPPDDVKGEVQRQLADLMPKIKLPGFRSGKVPRSLVQKRYGAALEADASRALVEKEYREAVQEHKLQPVVAPSLEDDALKPGPDGGIEIELEIEVLPEFDVGEYKGLRVTLPDSKVAEETVEHELQRLREARSTLEDAEPDERAAEGDILQADVTLQFLDGSSQALGQGRQLDLNSNFLDGIPVAELTEKCQGLAPGDEVKISVDIPENFPDEERAGKTAVAQCQIESIQHVVPPELDSEDFLRSFGEEIKTLDDLRTLIRDQVQSQMDNQKDRLAESLCIDQLVERLDFPLPEGLLKRSKEADVERFRNELSSQGADDVQIERQLLEAEGRLKQQSERKLRTSIVLDHIAVKEGVEILNEELEAHFQLLSRTLRIPAQDLFDTFQSNGTLPEVVGSLRRDKVRRLLRESSITSEMEEEEGSEESPSSTSASEEETA